MAFGLLLLVVAVLASGVLMPRTVGGGVAVRAGAPGRETAASRLPLAAQGPVSRAVGADDRAYLAARDGGGFVVGNAGQRLRARFDRRGIVVRSGGASLGLRLTGWGYPGALQAVGAVAPVAVANRVVYRHRGFAEWFANGPLGVEQGFTLPARPAGPHSGLLTLSLALSGNLRAVLARGADAVTFSGAGVSLAYRGLVASDARGRRLRARIELRGGGLLLRVDDRGAVYPLRIDPFVQQAKLTAADGAAGDFLGFSVAVSGSTVVVGAPYASVNGNSSQGAVYVFTGSAGSWTQQAKLTAADGAADDGLGYSVAVSGSRVVAGAPFAAVNGDTYLGAVYVFTNSAGSWSQQAKLTAADGAHLDLLGGSVAVSGNTVLAGARGATVNGNSDQGAVYVFTGSGGSWSQQAKLTAGDGAARDEFGSSVTMSGNTVVAGAPDATVNGNPFQGAAYVFTGSAGSWSQQAKLTAADGVIATDLGVSVAVSGTTVLVGAAGATFGQGAVYVFTNSAGSWSQQAELTASDGAAHDNFGVSVAVSGNTLVVGAPYADVNGQFGQGAVYVFTGSAGSWSQQAKLIAADGVALDQLGHSVAVSGNAVVAGAPDADVNGFPFQGAAYVFAGADPTASSVGCSPGTVAVGQSTTCTATLTDTAASPTTPTGSVSFVSDTGGGAFSNSGSCTLAPTTTTGQASCAVTYTPGQVGTGTHTITASYAGDSTHQASSNTAAVTVTGDPAITALGVSRSWPARGGCETVATFSDPDSAASASEYTTTIDWGDGRSSAEARISLVSAGGFRVSGCHRYKAVGPYTATIVISDVDNPANSATATSTLTRPRLRPRRAHHRAS